MASDRSPFCSYHSVVEGDQEQVPSIERIQHRLAAVVAGDCVTQRAAQPAQDGGLQQEAPDTVRLTLQDLFDQVVDDVAVVPREARDEARDVVPTLDRECGELECGDPPFGAPLQSRDVPRGQFETHHIIEIGGGLVRGEAQIGGADLDEFAATSQASQRQRRVGTGGDHEVGPWRQALQQEGDAGMDVVCVDHVFVVEHQHDVLRLRPELVEERREDRLDRRWLGLLQQGERARADPRRHPPQRRDQVGPE